MDQLKDLGQDARKPGVYVFRDMKNNVIVKVGRHLQNAMKRANEHIRDNTNNNDYQMRDFKDRSDIELLLFTLSNDKDLHWAFALEVFFEIKLKPAIKSGRLG